MNQQALSAFLWSVADLLRGDYKQSDYGKVILPFTVLRRIDCVLAPTKEAVLAELALRRSQKMEALGQLTGGVAHDFNNLLQVISGNLHLLSKDIAGNERAEMRVQNALAGVTRGSKLASQLLSFGRRQPLEPKVVNVGRFLQGMDDMLRRTLGEEIQLETVVAGGLWNTLVDPNQIENAVFKTIAAGERTGDLGGNLGTTAFTDCIISRL